MAWSVPKIGALATVASGNITLAEPAGIAAGDLMIACIGYRSNAAFTVPGDWNLVATQQSSGDTDATNGIASGVMMWCVRGGSAPTLTFNRTAGDVAQGRIIAYSGGHATTPFDVGSANTLASASATVTTGTLTTAEAGELIVAMTSAGDALLASAFDAATDPTTASGATDTTNAPTAGTWRERADTTTGTGADHGLAIADAIRATAGATGTIQATIAASARHVMIAAAFKLAASGGSATLTAAAGSVSLTGTAATLREAKILVASSVSVTTIGTAATLKQGYKVAASIGAINTTGLLSSLGQSTVIFGAAGNFALIGTAATLTRVYRLSAGFPISTPPGFTGAALSNTEIELSWREPEGVNVDIEATLTRGRTMVADSAIVTITGLDARIFKTPPVMFADMFLAHPVNVQGTAGGSTVELSWEVGPSIEACGLVATFSRTHVAAVGSFAATGLSTPLTIQHRLTADSGSIAATGTAVSFDRSMAAQSGTVGLTGTSAFLIYSPAGSQTLTAQSGAFTSDGIAVSFRVGRKLSAPSTGIVLTGLPASIGRQLEMDAGVGVIISTGLSATLSSSVKLLSATAGVFNVQGIAATFSSVPDVVPLVPPLTIDLDSGESTMVLTSGESSLHLES